ncbi:MAG TPA: ATP-grasp domain-containing protein [Desulfobacterales bacterium]|nr:ATP-grasp domain-containing protein [Desulfobacterales bacterium]
MRLLEHESKRILEKYRIALPVGRLVGQGEPLTIDGPVMLKAQIPIGGRGKAGGILEAAQAEEARQKVSHLLQSNIRGYIPKSVYMEEKKAVKQEFFMAITYDTVAKAPMAIFSAEGGVDIEELAQRRPELVRKEHFTVRSRLPLHRAREIVADAGVSGKLLLGLSAVLAAVAEIFLDYDATVVEINPLGLMDDGRLVALDCHLDVDDDAVSRHADIAVMEKDAGRVEGERHMTDFERLASNIDSLDHRGVAGRVIEFDGNLGLIIGGGGASLTAFDAIRAHGGRPANYCEVGGNPSVLKVKELTRLILSKPGVDKIAVIMNVVSNTRVDMMARGIVKGILESAKDPAQTVAVFRVPGAWEDEGQKILSKYGVPIQDRTVSIDEAARIAVTNAR